MSRTLSIFERFERRQSSHSWSFWSSEVIGRVLPRGFAADGHVFSAEKFVLPSQALPTPPMPPILFNGLEPVSTDPTQEPPVIAQTTHVHDVLDRAVGNVRAGTKLDDEERVVTFFSRSQEQSTRRRNSKAPSSSKRYRKANSDPTNPKSKLPRPNTLHRREQCRVNQERYRKKQPAHAKNVAVIVKELRHEVPLLEIQHTRMAYSAALTMWSVVTEYFDVFHYGSDPSHYAVCDSHLRPHNPKAQRQLVFLRSTMARDVIVSDQRGVNSLLQQWRRYSAYFGDLHLRLGRVTKPTKTLCWASATLSVSITKATLQYVFPHLTATGDANLAGIRSRMLGQRLIIPCQVCFEWDEDIKRVVRLETMINFLFPLLRLLGSLEDTAFVLEKTRIAPDCSIGKFSE